MNPSYTVNYGCKSPTIIRDATGNVLAVYEQVGDTMHWQEQHLYGSSRLGMLHPGVKRFPGDGLNDTIPYYIQHKEQPYGARRYEITNHLGNVTTTLSDRKMPEEQGGDMIYKAVVHSAVDYYPFGSIMPGRSFNSPDYRYSFNGKEKDDEIKGSGNSINFGARIYDPRTGRWLSVDPLASDYPSLSPYAYVANNPLNNIDPDGREIFPVHGTWSNIYTWGDLGGIAKASGNLFGDGNYNGNRISWSGGNYASMRTEAATKLVNDILKVRSADGYVQSEPVTLAGHSHGGNVSIEALNMMAEMEEFDGVELNLLTINTPVRDDYQLSESAAERVNHVNVYDPKDPVQSRGGNSLIVLPEDPSNKKGTGEYGGAGRTFNRGRNIRVSNPQGVFNGKWVPWGGMPIPQKGDFHNSHNRVNDWINNKPDQN